jgi:hypothetical protein
MGCPGRCFIRLNEPDGHVTYSADPATLSRMTVREPAELQHLPRDLEVLAFEAGCDYCEREIDELELQGGRVYLHLGVGRDEPPRR